MGKRLVYLLITILFVSLAVSSIPRIHSQPEDIKVTSYSYYINQVGFLDVVGEVQNVGQNTVDAVYIRGTVLGPTGADVGDSGTKVWVAYLVPQQKAPFMIEFHLNTGDSWTPDAIGQIQFTISSANATSSYQYPDLKITSSTPTIGTTGNYNGAYTVSGEIQNTGTQTASNLTVVAAFYNSTGSVVGVGYTDYLTPADLPPSGTMSFQIYALDLNQSEVPASTKIASYSLLVQTQEPILQGAAPVVSPYQTSDSSPSAGDDSTMNPESSSNPVQNSANPSNLTLIALIAVIAVIAVIGGIIVVRKRKPKTTKAEVVIPRKTTSKRER